MVLPPLATSVDLDARGIDTSNTARVDALLASASAAVREAAGAPITEVTNTVELDTFVSRRLRLPAVPVRSVDTVLLDDELIEDWVLRGNSLWRERGWQTRCDLPRQVTVTFTAGLDEVPADIVDLVCSMVGAGMAKAADGYEAKSGLIGESERIDDYQHSVQYSQGSDAVVSPMELPEPTRQWLASRFGHGPTMVETRG